MLERRAETNPRFMRWAQQHDTTRRYLTDSPTPAKIAATIKSADDGDVAAMCELMEEIEGKNSHIQGILARRRESITALDWSIEPDDVGKGGDQDFADVAAEFVQRELEGLETWPTTLEHLIGAIGPGVAVTELVWVKARLVETVDVPGHRLDVAPEGGGGLSLLTDEHSVDGIPIKTPGFAVHYPTHRAGFPLRVTLARALAYLWVIEHYALADWSAFSEIFGQPFRVATYEEEPNPDELDVIKDTLKNMGSDCWGVFPAGINVEFKEASRGTQPYKDLLEFVQTRMTTLVLGQTLTTEQGSVGSLALGQVHANVRASITRSDLQAERRTIRNQIIRYMVRFRWPGQDVPIPHFRRLIAETPDIEHDRLKLDKLRFMREAGLRVDEDVVYELLDIPKPKETKPD